MLGQRLSVAIVLPLALAVLVDDPLAEGDLHPGDLLLAVLRLPVDSWAEAGVDRDRLVARLRTTPLPDDTVADLRRAVVDLIG